MWILKFLCHIKSNGAWNCYILCRCTKPICYGNGDSKMQKNVPSFTFYESPEVLRFSNKIFCIQHIVISLSHHKFHINTEFLPWSFQLGIYMLLNGYIVWGIMFALIINYYLTFLFLARGGVMHKKNQVRWMKN